MRVVHRPSPGVAAHVRRIVVGGRRPEPPAHETGVGFVGHRDVVEDIRRAELAERDRHRAGDLAQRDARQDHRRLRIADAVDLAAGKCGHSQRRAQPSAAGELRLHDELRSAPGMDARAQVHDDGECRLRLGPQAVLPAVWRVELMVRLPRDRGLEVER